MQTNYLKKPLPGGRTGKQTLGRAVNLYSSRMQSSSQPSSESMPTGERKIHKLPDPLCGVCKDTGVVLVDPVENRWGYCACSITRQARMARSLSKMTEDERLYRLDDVVPSANGQGTRDMLAVARAFLDEPVYMLTIHGKPGNAKSVTVVALVNELNERGIPAYYITLFDLLEMIRRAYRVDDNKNMTIRSEDAYDLLMRFSDARVLAIDEFDKVKKETDWMLQTVTALIDNRYRNGSRIGTLIAMNNDIESLPGWIADRLLDGRNRCVQNDDPSLRPMMRR